MKDITQVYNEQSKGNFRAEHRVHNDKIISANRPCIIAELSFKKKLCRYLGINAARQA